jgi:L-fuconolactonase
MDRRDVLKLGSAFTIASAAEPFSQASQQLPVIDCHIHLFDPTRPGGVPWPLKDDTVIYKPAVPARYEKIAKPFGIVGAIAVEASPLASDNDWVLQLIADHPIIVGVVGDLVPGSTSFGPQLDRLHKNPLFVGIRYGNLWDHDLSIDMKKPGFLDDVRKLASSGLTLDSANPDPKLIRALLDVSQQVPELRIVIDHLPNAVVPSDAEASKEYSSHLKALGQNKRVFIKLSEIPVKENGRVPTAVSFYKDKLDAIWDLFGEDHILFGSDWPNSDHLATYRETFGIVRRYVSVKGRVASEKFFHKNSQAAYQWKPRSSDQAAAV